MASVRVRIDDLERGDLPALSIKTGAACESRRDRCFVRNSGHGRRGVRRSPRSFRSKRHARTRRSLTRISWAILVSVAAALVAAITGAGAVALVAAAVVFVAYVALLFVGDLRWIGSRPADHDGEIVLTRVNRAFARAVDEQYGR